MFYVNYVALKISYKELFKNPLVIHILQGGAMVGGEGLLVLWWA